MATDPSKSSTYACVAYKQELGTLSLLKSGLLFEANTASANKEDAGYKVPSRSLKLKLKDVNKITTEKATSAPKSTLRLSHINGKTTYTFNFSNRDALETFCTDIKKKWKQQQSQQERFKATSFHIMSLREESVTEISYMTTGNTAPLESANIEYGAENSLKDNRRHRSSTATKKDPEGDASFQGNEQSQASISYERKIEFEDELQKSLPAAAAEIIEEPPSGLPIDETTLAKQNLGGETKQQSGCNQPTDGAASVKEASPPPPGKESASASATIATSPDNTSYPGNWSCSDIEGKVTSSARTMKVWGGMTNRQKRMMFARVLGCCLIIMVIIILVAFRSRSVNGYSSKIQSSTLLRGSTAPSMPVPTPENTAKTTSPSISPVTRAPKSDVPTPKPTPFPTTQTSPFSSPRPSLYPTPFSSVYCRRLPERIQVDNKATKIYDCDAGVTPVRFLWRTAALNNQGFSDDEYFINAYQEVSGNFVQVYQTPDEVDGMVAAEAISEVIGSGEVSRFRAEFECNLEVPFKSCEDGTFEFAFVACGCPVGQILLEPCVATSLETARDAICIRS